ncbi:VCBS domain-containing protein, partial [Hoeflea marina]|uniref:VCBS domain-containing protein n=1 Tax=Hoeflea marina TaxID=274592 RepID=UPI001AED0496
MENTPPVEPVRLEIEPDAQNRVLLSANVSLENIRVDGDDLILVQADGSEIRILGGALDIPTFVVGDTEIPRDVLVAALNANGFDVAAGSNSVAPQAPAGSGSQFQDGEGGGIGGEGPATLALLGDDTGSFGETGAASFTDVDNFEAILIAGDFEGGLVESADTVGGVDEDAAPATGSISFNDTFYGLTIGAEVATRTLVEAQLDSGLVLTPGQVDALLAGFSLEDADGIATGPAANGDSTINWTYAVPNSAVDFLAAGETVTLSFDVNLTGGNLPTQSIGIVTIVVTGTNDAPEITAQTDVSETLVEDEGVVQTSGAFDVRDVDISDTVSVSGIGVAASGDIAGLPDAAALLGMFTVTPGLAAALIDGASTTGTVAWSFNSGTDQFDYLAAGEQLVITYTVTLSDDSAVAGSVTQDVTVTITGTNDAPVVDTADVTGAVTEPVTPVGDLTDSGTIGFSDV